MSQKKNNLFQRDRSFPTKETAAKAQRNSYLFPHLVKHGQDRTQRWLSDFLWIQEISQTWCIAKFEYDDRIPLCTLTSACRLRRTVSSEQAQAGGNLIHVYHSQKRTPRGLPESTDVPSVSQSSQDCEEKCSQLASLPCFSFNKELGTENFLKQIVTEFLLKRKAQAPFIKSNKSIMKWSSGNMFYS